LIVGYIGWDNISSSLVTFNFWWLIPAVFFWVLIYFFNALNLHFLINKDDRVMRLWDVFRFYWVSMGISAFVPGLIGQASIIPLIKKDVGNFSKGTAVFILDRVWVLLFVLLGAICGSILILPREKAILFMIAGLIFSIVYALFFLTGTGVKTIYYLCPKFLKIRFRDVFEILLDYPNHKELILKNVGCSMARWVAKAMFACCLFAGFGVFISPLKTFVVSAWEALVALVPISFSGLGLREGTGLFLYGHIGVVAGTIGAMYFLVNLIWYVTAGLSFFMVKREDFSWRALFAKEAK